MPNTVMLKNVQLEGENNVWAGLLRDHAYNTPPARYPLCEYFPPWAWLKYYMLTNYALLCASARARFRTYGRREWAWSCYHLMRAAERAGGRFEITGLENVAKTAKPVVIVSNHMSMLETYVLPTLILPFRDMKYVLKKDLLYYPIFGIIIHAINPIAVSRDDPAEDLRTVMTEGEEWLAQGGSVVAFPQSTRTALFDRKMFNSLGAKLAARAGVPMIPLAIKTDFVSNGKLVKSLGPVDPSLTIHMEFGAPIEVTRPGKKEHALVVDFIESRLRKWNGQVVDHASSTSP